MYYYSFVLHHGGDKRDFSATCRLETHIARIPIAEPPAALHRNPRNRSSLHTDKLAVNKIPTREINSLPIVPLP